MTHSLNVNSLNVYWGNCSWTWDLSNKWDRKASASTRYKVTNQKQAQQWTWQLQTALRGKRVSEWARASDTGWQGNEVGENKTRARSGVPGRLVWLSRSLAFILLDFISSRTNAGTFPRWNAKRDSACYQIMWKQNQIDTSSWARDKRRLDLLPVGMLMKYFDYEAIEYTHFTNSTGKEWATLSNYI